MIDLKDFTPSTKAYVKNVYKMLESKFGTVEKQWEHIISILAEESDVYILASLEVRQKGLFCYDNNGKSYVNPARKVATEALTQINKLLEQLCVTPKMEVRLKIQDNDTAISNDFIDNLTK